MLHCEQTFFVERAFRGGQAVLYCQATVQMTASRATGTHSLKRAV